MSVSELAEHCVHLRHVDVEQLSHATASVLMALGSRVRVLRIVDKLISSGVPCREMYGACTNLEAVHLRLNCCTQAVDVLSLMRAKLISLKLRHIYNLVAIEDRLFPVLSTCSALEEVELYMQSSLSEALLTKLFECLKLVTALTCFKHEPEVNPSKVIVDTIARHLTNLESFTLSSDTLCEGEDVKALVGLPHLKSVSLQCPFFMKSGSKPLEECTVEIMEKLKEWAQLEQLEIRRINIRNRCSIAETAVTYKRKDFDMFIGDVQYRTW